MTTPRFQRDIYIVMNEQNKVVGWSSSSFAPGEKKITVSFDHEVMKFPQEWRYQNGVLEKVPAFVAEEQKKLEEILAAPSDTDVLNKIVNVAPGKALEAAEQFNKAVILFAQTLPDEKKLELPEIYPAWEIGKQYAIGETVRYGVDASGKSEIFSVLQAHLSQANWLPPAVPAIYKKISFAPSGVPNWVQPLGGTDAYALNAIVMHKTKKWKSTVANNVWEPGVYGWVVVT